MTYRCVDCGYVLKDYEEDYADVEYCPSCHAIGVIVEEE